MDPRVDGTNIFLRTRLSPHLSSAGAQGPSLGSSTPIGWQETRAKGSASGSSIAVTITMLKLGAEDFVDQHHSFDVHDAALTCARFGEQEDRRRRMLGYARANIDAL